MAHKSLTMMKTDANIKDKFISRNTSEVRQNTIKGRPKEANQQQPMVLQKFNRINEKKLLEMNKNSSIQNM